MKRKAFLWMGVMFLFMLGATLISPLVMGQSGGPETPLAPVGAGFTYQGQIRSGNSLVTANCTLQFSLWNAAADGNQIGSTQVVTGVAISEGLFTVRLNDANQFGGAAFDGQGRWLQIGVQCPTDPNMVMLTPRQEIAAAPYAQFSQNSDLLDGHSSSAFALADHTHPGSAYGNVIIVAKSGGDFTDLSTALNSITDATATNRYLIWVGPGIYNGYVYMKPYVDIEGAGERTTLLTAPGAGGGTVTGANHAELRFIGVEATGGAFQAVGIINNTVTDMRLLHVTVNAFGATNRTYGIFNYDSTVSMTDVTVTATDGSEETIGVYNLNGAAVDIVNLTVNVTTNAASGRLEGVTYGVSTGHLNGARITATSGGSGILLSLTTAPIVVSNVEGTISCASFCYGARVALGRPTLDQVRLTVQGAATSYGIYLLDASVTVQDSVVESLGTTRYGLYYTSSNGVSQSAVFMNSKLSGATNTIFNHAAYTSRIMHSQLAGGVITAGGPVTCIGAYDESFATAGYGVCP